MYDQFGFYSENGFAGAGDAGAPGGGGQRGHGFQRLRFLRFRVRSGRGGNRCGAAPKAAGAGGFRDIFSQFFGGRRRGRPDPKPKKAATSST